ncbi:hypothetical protein L3Q82_015435, partial [Scortum barcoo]
MGVDDTMISWITDYLTGRPQFVHLGSVLSDVVVSDTGAPRELQGTVLSPFLFTLYTTDFQYNSESCHLQRFSDDSAVVVRCIREGEEGADWDQWLPYLPFAYREVPQASTGFSPFEVLYGHQ